MFQKLIGKIKPEPDPMANIEKLTQTLDMLEKRENNLAESIATEIKKAKDFVHHKNRAAAVKCLKRKKALEREMENLANYQLRIHDQIITLEGIKAATVTVDALRIGAAAMKDTSKSMHINDLDETMDEINEQTESIRQMQEKLSAPIGVAADFYEDELEAELGEIEGAELEEQLLQPAAKVEPVPFVSLPSSKQPVPPQKKTVDEVEELAALQAEMAL